jgi:CBS domain-containing protein
VTLPAWQDQFARWIEQPEEDALLEAAILFDFRQLHGELDAEAPLRFLRHLHGERPIDLKAHGIAPIVDLARLLALEAGSPETSTVGRVRSAAAHGTAGTAAPDLVAAFEYLQEVRLRHQAGRLAGGAAPDDRIDPDELTALQRRWLKDALQLLHTCQDSVRIAYRTDLIG